METAGKQLKTDSLERVRGQHLLSRAGFPLDERSDASIVFNFKNTFLFYQKFLTLSTVGKKAKSGQSPGI